MHEVAQFNPSLDGVAVARAVRSRNRQRRTMARALKLIAKSSLHQFFDDPINWGQWSRQVANAALYGNDEALDAEIQRCEALQAAAREHGPEGEEAGS